MWEGVGDWTELQHIDPHFYGHNVSFPFSWAAQPVAKGPSLSGTCSSFQHLLSNWPLNRGPEGPLCWVLVLSTATFLQLSWTSCCRGYMIIIRPLNSNLSTVKVIPLIPYLHRCISYFDSLAGSEVNIQHFQVDSRNVLSTAVLFLLGWQVLVLLFRYSSFHSFDLLIATLIMIVYILPSFLIWPRII